MNHLLRSQAPISDAGWKLLDEEARARLVPALAVAVPLWRTVGAPPAPR